MTSTTRTKELLVNTGDIKLLIKSIENSIVSIGSTFPSSDIVIDPQDNNNIRVAIFQDRPVIGCIVDPIEKIFTDINNIEMQDSKINITVVGNGPRVTGVREYVNECYYDNIATVDISTSVILYPGDIDDEGCIIRIKRH